MNGVRTLESVKFEEPQTAQQIPPAAQAIVIFEEVEIATNASTPLVALTAKPMEVAKIP